MIFAHGETITRLRAALGVDPYSGEAVLLDWDNAAELSIEGCGFDPGGSSEPTQDARNAVVTKPTVYAPAGVDVVAGDRIVVRGVTYAVEGTPADWRHPMTGWRPGLVINLKGVEG